MNSKKKEFGVYQVGQKILLHRADGKVLILRLKSGRFDLPGGRIDNIEYRMPLEKILAREIREELGGEVKYKLGPTAFQYHFPHKNGGIFQTVYEADYLAGEIKLSSEHRSFMWVSPESFRFHRKDFPVFATYLGFKKYFQKYHEGENTAK
ncbi:MAG: NUDIX domain-containing protein [Candidatus Sungbacteria bacterium]|nr:NUDIX domain-containing protein [Candidatus Sungbacteria bacterium]